MLLDGGGGRGATTRGEAIVVESVEWDRMCTLTGFENVRLEVRQVMIDVICNWANANYPYVGSTTNADRSFGEVVRCNVNCDSTSFRSCYLSSIVWTGRAAEGRPGAWPT